MRLLLLEPEWAARSCVQCIRYQYDGDGNLVTRAGVPQRRPNGQPTPCWKCPKIPRGDRPTPANGVELTERSRVAYRLYLERKATNDFSDADWLDRRHAVLIRQVEEVYNQRLSSAAFASALVRVGVKR